VIEARRVIGCIASLLLAVASAEPARGDAESASGAAISWLTGNQNPDGSWGSEGVSQLYTSEAVTALRAHARRDSAYFRGVAWLENHAVQGTDYHARRILALRLHGDDVTSNVNYLLSAISSFGTPEGGWGLSEVYAASALDTALAILALAESGFTPESIQPTADAIEFLVELQDDGGDFGWSGSSGVVVENPGAQGDVVVSSLVLRALGAARDGIASQVQVAGSSAVDFLKAAVTSGSEPLLLGHAILAYLRWDRAAAMADPWVQSRLGNLLLAQDATGHWQGDAYVTAVALQALAGYLGVDDPQLRSAVVIPDLGLRGAINLALGRNRADAISRAEIHMLTSLDASNQGIESLTGIEEAIHLQSINLLGNTIANLAPLDLLPSLQVATVTIPCDVDLNGVVGLPDALLALRSVRGDLTLTIPKRTAADVAPPGAPDRVVTAGDVTPILRKATGLSSSSCEGG
jgi:hypothetical protein